MKSQQVKGSDINRAETMVISDIMPVTSYDATANAFMLSTGLYMDMFEIVPKDLNTADSDATDFDNALFAKLFNTYKGDLKVIAFNFPVNTAHQQRYFKKKIRNTDHPVHLELLRRRLGEQEYIAQNFTDRQYVLMYFAESREALKKKCNSNRSSAKQKQLVSYTKSYEPREKISNAIPIV